MTELNVWNWKPSRWWRFRERWGNRLRFYGTQWLVCSWRGHVYRDEGDDQHCERCFKTLPPKLRLVDSPAGPTRQN